MLILGNSFTYYYGPVYMLKELARSQGHDIQLRAFVKGSQYFRDFQHLELAQNVIREGRYAYALLQDASMQHAYYFNDARSNAPVYTETEELFNEVRQYSPGVRLVLESTWAYSYQDYKGFGSFEAFDDANITHVEGGVDPLRDIDIIQTELCLADLEVVEKRIMRLAKIAKSQPERGLP